MSVKNKLTDLNNHLFEQLERLNDEELKGEQLTAEINRAKAISEVAAQIVLSARVSVEAMKLVGRDGIKREELPGVFENQKQLSI